MDTAFITGGTGFVGANLVRLLIEKGLQVKALVRRGSNRGNLEGLPVERIEGDKAVVRGWSMAQEYTAAPPPWGIQT